MTVWTIAALSLGSMLIGAACAWFVFKFVSGFDRRLTALELEKDAREKLLVDARGRARSHHAYNTRAGLEDTISLNLDALEDIEAQKARLETSLAILQVLRSSPYAYDPERKYGGKNGS